MYNVSSLQKIEYLDEQTDVCKIAFNNGEIEAYIFGSYDELITYLGKDVIVTFRQDIYQGNIVQAVNNLALPIKVNTVEKTSDVKLCVDYTDETCNVCFQDIEVGTTVKDAIVLCQSYEYNSSEKATWVEMRCTDRMGRSAIVRQFSYDEKDKNFAGKYVTTSLRRNKYGFNAGDVIYALDTIPNLNPEIDVCEKYIMERIVDDAELLDYVATSRIFEHMRNYVDKERGYLICRTAYEIMYLTDTNDIYPNLDIKLLVLTAILDKAFCMSPDSDLSRSIVNIVLLARYKFTDKKKLNLMLDSEPKVISKEKEVYEGIKAFVDNIINAKKDM